MSDLNNSEIKETATSTATVESTVTVVYLLTFTPQYLSEGLQELAPCVNRCLLVPVVEGVDREYVTQQARASLSTCDIQMQEGTSTYNQALNSALSYAGEGWLLVLESDELVDYERFSQALADLPHTPGGRYTVPTHFFWHDSDHVINDQKWQRRAVKPRLLWVSDGERLEESGRPMLADGVAGPPDLENALGWEVLNYSHAVSVDVMQSRVSPDVALADPAQPTNWFSPWWMLGVNKLSAQVKAYAGVKPSTMMQVRHRVIFDQPHPVPPSSKPPLVWEGWIGQEISYGVITDYTMRHLEAHGWETHVHPVGLLGPQEAVPSPTRRAMLRESERRQSLHESRNAIVVKNSHTGDWTQLQYPKAPIKIGYSPHERVALDPADVRKANLMDAVMVTSTYVQRVFESSGVKRPFYVYHHGYDPDWLHVLDRPLRDTFTFLAISVLNLRKGPDLLLSAFSREFSQQEDVHLVVKTSPHIWHKELHNELMKQYGNHPQITFLPNHHTEAQIASLYYNADCFVLPTRGEGFGMPTFEAMVTGLPVITTNWSGHLDFCTQENSYLIDVRNRDQLEFVMGCEPWWAAPDEEHLASLMRYVFEHREEARQRGMQAAKTVAGWTWARQVSKLSSFLETL